MNEDALEGFANLARGAAGVVAFWYLVEPRSAWQTFVAWRYRKPEALTPSKAGFTAYRVVAAIALVALVVSA